MTSGVAFGINGITRWCRDSRNRGKIAAQPLVTLKMNMFLNRTRAVAVSYFNNLD